MENFIFCAVSFGSKRQFYVNIIINCNTQLKSSKSVDENRESKLLKTLITLKPISKANTLQRELC